MASYLGGWRRKEDVYAIEGVWAVDSFGLPQFPVDGYLSTLIHEFNHSFVNYLTLAHLSHFRPAGLTEITE
jgi:hypothetical protein